jgi:broad specificity phosphatase PhoE
VRHGRPLIDRSAPAHSWPLDPAYADDVRALAPRLPAHARWFSSPEPKAIATALLLHDAEVTVVDDLREHERRSTDWIDDFAATVRRAFDRPGEPAHHGWEPLEDCRRRVVAAADGLRTAHPADDLVLVGHGTAWTLLAASLRGGAPDLDRWAGLDLPDLIVV